MQPLPIQPLPKFNALPHSFPTDGALNIEFHDGIPIIRASFKVQERIENLLSKQKEYTLSQKENEELDKYEEIDSYLSLLNRINRNLYLETNSNILNVLTQKTIR